MFQKLLDLFRASLFLTRDVQENKNTIARLEQELKDLSDIVVHLQSETRHGFENERHEREKFMLRVENALLRFERSLPNAPKKRK